MTQYIIRRLLLFIPTMILATVMVFALFWIVPGDAAMMILTGEEGEGGRVNTEDLEQLRKELGLDRPIHVQYGEWVFNLLKGDLGTSIWYRIPVMDELRDRFLVLHGTGG